MVAAGVDPARIQVAGYGEFRPIVLNGTKGAAENRRVELVMVPRRPEVAARRAMPVDDKQPVIEEPMK